MRESTAWRPRQTYELPRRHGPSLARQLLHRSLAASERKPERELRRLALGGRNTRAGTLAGPNTMLYPCTEARTSFLSGIFRPFLNSKRMEIYGPIRPYCKHLWVRVRSGIAGQTSRKGSELPASTQQADARRHAVMGAWFDDTSVPAFRGTVPHFGTHRVVLPTTPQAGFRPPPSSLLAPLDRRGRPRRSAMLPCRCAPSRRRIPPRPAKTETGPTAGAARRELRAR